MSREQRDGTELRVVEDSSAPLAQRSDDDLMLLARGGLLGAFDALVRRHQAQALRIAHKHVGSLHLAEDVTQEAFVELHKTLPRYRPMGKLRFLLFRIVLSRARMARRSWKRSRLDLTEELELVAGPEAERRVLVAERDHELHRALARLSERERSVIVLRFGGGLEYSEISETLGIPVGTAKSRVFKAVVKLRRFLRGVDLG